MMKILAAIVEAILIFVVGEVLKDKLIHYSAWLWLGYLAHITYYMVLKEPKVMARCARLKKRIRSKPMGYAFAAGVGAVLMMIYWLAISRVWEPRILAYEKEHAIAAHSAQAPPVATPETQTTRREISKEIGESVRASDTATILKNPLKHPTRVTGTGPKVQETPAKDSAAPVTVIQVATPFGNLKDRAVALSQEIMHDLYKHGWPYTDNHNLPPPTSSIFGRPMPRDREGLSAWMRTRGLVFRLEYLPKVRAITNEFAEFHIRDQQLDQFLETEKMIQQDNEQMTARGVKVIENPLFPQQIEDVAERLMVMAERIK